MEQRFVKGDAELSLGVVRVFHHNGIALHHGAHGLACLLRVLCGNSGHSGHEDAVHLLRRQVPEMSVYQLGREADGVRGNSGKSRLVHFSRAHVRELYLVPKSFPKGAPERHELPIGEDSGKADGEIPLYSRFRTGIVFEEKFFPSSVHIGHSVDFLGLLPELFSCLGVLRSAQHLSPLAAIVCHPGIAV